MKQTVCPHCARMFVSTNFSRHETGCVYKPSVRESIRQWFDENAAEVDGKRYCPSQNFYITRSAQDGLPSISKLATALGDWHKICRFFAPHLLPVSAKPSRKNQREYSTANDWKEVSTLELLAIVEENDGQLPSYNEIQERLTYRFRVKYYGYQRFCIEFEIGTPARTQGGTQEWKTSQATYAVRDDELLAAYYRPPVKVRKEDKDRAERLCAGIADEVERLRVWFRELGYPVQAVEAVTG